MTLAGPADAERELPSTRFFARGLPRHRFPEDGMPTRAERIDENTIAVGAGLAPRSSARTTP